MENRGLINKDENKNMRLCENVFEWELVTIILI